MGKILVDIRDENDEIKKLFENKDLVSVEKMLEAIDQLLYEVEHREEELEDYKKYVEENYKWRW